MLVGQRQQSLPGSLSFCIYCGFVWHMWLEMQCKHATLQDFYVALSSVVYSPNSQLHHSDVAIFALVWCIYTGAALRTTDATEQNRTENGHPSHA